MSDALHFLDVATVVVGDGPWMLGWEDPDRTCGLTIGILDPCLPDTTADVVGDSTTPVRAGAYRIMPFGISAWLWRSFMCAMPDDDTWVKQQLDDATSRACALSMCKEVTPGNETWLGAPGVVDVPLAATDPTTVASGVEEGRRLWADRNAGNEAILMLSYDRIRPLKAEDAILTGTDGTITTVWGDRVVVDMGFPAETTFWVAPGFEVRLASVDVFALFAARLNDSVVKAERLAAVNVPPCTMVRVGPVPVVTTRQSLTASPEGTNVGVNPVRELVSTGPSRPANGGAAKTRRTNSRRSG